LGAPAHQSNMVRRRTLLETSDIRIARLSQDFTGPDQ
jgi:hypothetical protein